MYVLYVIDDLFYSLLDYVVWDMAFPDDERESNPASFKFLEMAHKWARAAGSGGVGSSSLLQLPKPVHSETAAESTPADVRDGSADVDKEMESSDEEED